jgi:gliding motility-associated-like protein
MGFGITAKFSFAKNSNCAPTVVNFTNLTIGSNLNFTWNFGSGADFTTSDKTDKVVSYPDTGKYKVTLTVTDGTNTDSTSQIVNIFKGPVAGFTAGPTDGCAPLFVKLSNTTLKGNAEITSVTWDFRNGTSLSGNNVTHRYDSVGTYDILMKVTDKNNCFDFVEMKELIKVVKRPVVNFKASDTFTCTPPLNVTFLNLSTGATNLNYNWNFGNRLTSQEINSSCLYKLNGSFNVKLVATDQYGCADSLIKNSYIKIGNRSVGIIVKDFSGNTPSNALICPGTYIFKSKLASQNDNKWIITYQNKTQVFINVDSIIFPAKDSGNLNINLIAGANSLCPDTAKITYIIDFLKADFSIDNSVVCNLPKIIGLKSLSQNENLLTWVFPDGKINHDSVTSYNIPNNLTYKQLYSHIPNHFNLPFKLIAKNTVNGCKDSVIKSVPIELPVARLMPDKISGCAPLTVTFSDSSRSDFSITNRTYVFPNFSLSVQDNNPVKQTFNDPGVFNVFEIIKSGQGCTDTSEKVLIRVGDKLVGDFTISPSSICNGDQIHITANSNLKDSIKLWQISGKNIFNLAFKHKPDTLITVYTDSVGSKDITLETDYNGCITDLTKTNVLNITGPAGNIIESFSCDSPLVYKFKTDINPATSLNWKIDTSNIKNTDSVKYSFQDHGDFSVQLTAKDNTSGCSLIKNKIIKVRLVKAAFLADSVICAGDTFKVNASKSADYINICHDEGFLWDFGDKTPKRRTFLNNYFHIYSTKGRFYPTLITTGDNGCEDTIKKLLRILQPVAKLEVDKDSGCVPQLNVTLKNISTDSSIVSWVWTFGDNSIPLIYLQQVTHNYRSNSAKTFYPQLKVKDNFGCTASASHAVSLVSVDSAFQADDNSICINQQVVFIPGEKNLDSFSWDFGDDQNSKITSNHIYNKTGKYDVTFSASKYGCKTKNKRVQYISVENANADYIVSDSILKCYPDTILFTHLNTNGSSVYTGLWRFGDRNNTDGYSTPIQYVFTRPGTYKTSLFVKTQNNCQATSSKTIIVNGPKAFLDFTPSKICNGESVNFSIDSLQDVVSWQLIFNDGNVSPINPTTNPIAHKYAAKGLGSIIPQILLINNDCRVFNGSKRLFVSPLTANFNFTDSNNIICFGNTLETKNKSKYFSSSIWEINNNTLSTKTDLTGVYLNELGVYEVKLLVKDIDNCTDSIVKQATLAPLPTFKITGDTSICKDNDSTVLNVSHNNNWKVLWQPSDGLSNQNSFSPVAKPDNTTTYFVKVTSENNCETDAKKTIIVKQPFDLKRLPVGDTSIFIGQKIQLSILSDSGVKYEWSPNYKISCMSCSNPFVAPEKTTVYSVKVKDKCYTAIQTFNLNVIVDYFLEAPNAFTPNGDNNNDIFRFEMKDIKKYELKIFNRWGDLIFWTENPDKGWDGKFNGKLQNIDTYSYFIKAETIYGYKFEKKGNLLLLK